jgi:hypothetical protein
MEPKEDKHAPHTTNRQRHTGMPGNTRQQARKKPENRQQGKKWLG